MGTGTKTKPAPTNGKPATKVISNHPLALCKPLDDRVVVRRDIFRQNQTQGGILIPETAMSNDKQQTGTVWSVGPGKRHPQTGEIIPVPLKKGDRVIITSYAGLEIKGDPMSANTQEEFVILREEDIVATLPSQNDEM